MAGSSQQQMSDPPAQMYPQIESAAVAGILLGAIVADVIAWWHGYAFPQWITCELLGMLAGAVIGPLMAVHSADPVQRVDLMTPPQRAPQAGGAWDHWFDAEALVAADPGIVVAAEEPSAWVVPRRAPVRPRVIALEIGESMRLEDEILPFVRKGEPGAIRIEGPAGSGKTTALRHLAAVLPPELGVCVLDEPVGDDISLADRAAQGVVVYAAGAAALVRHLVTFRLAPWGEDERIEYLLATARPQCKSVMARLKRAPDSGAIGGNPELWRIVLDRMAGDARLLTIRDALRQELAVRLSDEALRRQVVAVCLRRLREHDGVLMPTEPESDLAVQGYDKRLARLLHHRAIQLLVAAEGIVADLVGPEGYTYLAAPLPRDLVREAGQRIRRSKAAQDRLQEVMFSSWRDAHPMAASLLHAAGVGWFPWWLNHPKLTGAYFVGAAWQGIDLPRLELMGADLSGADLSQALLDETKADKVRLPGANLRHASLDRASAREADLSQADLGSLRGEGVQLDDANLEGANLEAASLQGARFCGANLTRAQLVGADLTGADLSGAEIAGADFTGAKLDSAVLKGLSLAQSDFRSARFGGADLSECDLEGMELPDAVFREVILDHALLTGSKMPGADFRGASLRQARLAEVDWEGACLAGADLRLATFHRGTTQSDMAEDPIACTGSRTGFYADHSDVQDYKLPEEIRTANLRGADLRGALIDDVDFHLVDLRDAVFDDHQAEQFRRCGAILADDWRSDGDDDV